MQGRVIKPQKAYSRKILALDTFSKLMKNERWFETQLTELSESKSIKKIILLGARTSQLAQHVSTHYPDTEIIICGSPSNESDASSYYQGNIVDYNEFDKETVIISNLFIHSFTNEQLWELSEKIYECRAFIIAESHRYWFSTWLIFIIAPFIKQNSRREIKQSIRSGFRFGELAGLLHLDWHWDERATLGGIHAITKNIDSL